MDDAHNVWYIHHAICQRTSYLLGRIYSCGHHHPVFCYRLGRLVAPYHCLYYSSPGG